MRGRKDISSRLVNSKVPGFLALSANKLKPLRENKTKNLETLKINLKLKKINLKKKYSLFLLSQFS